ncbi:TPA: transcriptional regulator [Serratia fonticola]
MQLKDYMSTLKRGEITKLAERIGISKSYLSQMASGTSPVPPARAPAIEEATLGAVTRADLRPKDWFRIWPEYTPVCDQPKPESE